METSARLLRLLSLLQMRREWPSRELAERLGVTTRTVRRDVEKLRGLGYPVHSSMGAAGGYRLGGEAALPPLLLDDDEAVAVVVGLRTAAGGTVEGIEEASLRALAKMEQVLPPRLRHRVSTLEHAVVAVPPHGGPVVESAVLTAISAAVRGREVLRFDYVDHHGDSSLRDVEPHRLVSWGRRWYLVGWDRGRADWRTFRVDRMRLRTPNGPRFPHREPPDGDVVAYLRRTMGFEMWPLRCRLRVHAPASDLTGRVDGVVTPVDARSCLLELPTDSFDMVAFTMALLDLDFEVESPPELARRLTTLSRRFAAAATPRTAARQSTADVPEPAPDR
ncbi:putative DNA-binding transcriptional regulator YafY, contains an HTH and WYL domains [Streptoalloteichus tenebrarius]|uniref:DNA-binding transcriptional regulator YafY, contains an HTH and WYL domains n=2 Tax=Streptoalloteichus tenebrarius (strain ATCC 17920 / DSM 40477 / JCM 4838 / CBS 697.72 / NBRC 16177 / NCIMB 11028 / NRRL B-12390 / A12253. 1 / ISP 5477) TaxID=1933 RepID=A0ABT1HUD3_STRSD|nr:putative DNA-binding transcriptional regulator YafY, contains an HTH and WYL domains [Streptoalloteichus tenebrarius]